MKIGVISGHVIDVFTTNAEEIEVETPYGNILLWYTKKGSREIFFLNRHGKNANLPPHKINYQAIIHALKVSNVDCILSLGTVGSLKSSI
ncbi:MAG TPA: S-methyl-5'-thioadenosine phosphorylase, partial [Thermoplasmatales archaeon]|nr:S-methyl-5'-thioadenosine phosphorylase [Thermoplasmatales archaeon]